MALNIQLQNCLTKAERSSSGQRDRVGLQETNMQIQVVLNQTGTSCNKNGWALYSKLRRRRTGSSTGFCRGSEWHVSHGRSIGSAALESNG